MDRAAAHRRRAESARRALANPVGRTYARRQRVAHGRMRDELVARHQIDLRHRESAPEAQHRRGRGDVLGLAVAREVNVEARGRGAGHRARVRERDEVRGGIGERHQCRAPKSCRPARMRSLRNGIVSVMSLLAERGDRRERTPALQSAGPSTLRARPTSCGAWAELRINRVDGTCGIRKSARANGGHPRALRLLVQLPNW